MPDNAAPLPDFTRWPSFPFEGEMRVKALDEPVAVEPPRHGEDGTDCVSCGTPDEAYIWVSERWRVRAMDRPTGLPMVLILESRSHLDLGDLPNLLAAELGVMTVRLERAVRSLDGVARVHVNRWGDGSAHLHLWFLARPYGRLQLRGTFLSLWDDILPDIPENQWRENLALVAAWLAEFGGRPLAEPPHIAWQSPSTIDTSGEQIEAVAFPQGRVQPEPEASAGEASGPGTDVDAGPAEVTHAELDEHAATGDHATPSTATGEATTVELATRRAATGEAATLDLTTRAPATGDRATGDSAAGDSAADDSAADDSAKGDAATGDQVAGDTTPGDASTWDAEGGTEPGHEHSGREVASGSADRPTHHVEQSRGQNPSGQYEDPITLPADADDAAERQAPASDPSGPSAATVANGGRSASGTRFVNVTPAGDPVTKSAAPLGHAPQSAATPANTPLASGQPAQQEALGPSRNVPDAEIAPAEISGESFSAKRPSSPRADGPPGERTTVALAGRTSAAVTADGSPITSTEMPADGRQDVTSSGEAASPGRAGDPQTARKTVADIPATEKAPGGQAAEESPAGQPAKKSPAGQPVKGTPADQPAGDEASQMEEGNGGPDATGAANPGSRTTVDLRGKLRRSTPTAS